jgi:hypothetical protein
MSGPYRDDERAALEKVARLEAENHRLEHELLRERRGAARRSPYGLVAAAIILALGAAVVVSKQPVPETRPAIVFDEPSEDATPPPEGLSFVEGMRWASKQPRPPAVRGLTHGEMYSALYDDGYLARCGFAPGTRVVVDALVRKSVPIGVSVEVTPSNAAVSKCIEAHVRTVRWPYSSSAERVQIGFGP